MAEADTDTEAADTAEEDSVAQEVGVDLEALQEVVTTTTIMVVQVLVEEDPGDQEEVLEDQEEDSVVEDREDLVEVEALEASEVEVQVTGAGDSFGS